MFLFFHFFQFSNFLFLLKWKIQRFLFSLNPCFLIRQKPIHTFDLKIISAILQWTMFSWDRFTRHPIQPYAWPWGLHRRRSLTGHEIAEGGKDLEKLVALHCCLDHEETTSRYHHGVLQPSGLLSPQQGQLARLSPLWCLGKFPFLRNEHDDTCFFPLLAVAVINDYISQWVLNYLLKLYMASPIWHWCQRGICLPREPEEHSELLQGENQLISLLMSNLQPCEFCRWQPDETAADLSPAGLDAAPQASLGPDHLGQPKEDPNLPRLSLQSVTQPTYCLKLPGEWEDAPRPSCASSSCHSSWTSRKNC